MNWTKFYKIVISSSGDEWFGETVHCYYDVIDINSGENVGTFEVQELAIKHVEELYEMRMQEIEDILLKE